MYVCVQRSPSAQKKVVGTTLKEVHWSGAADYFAGCGGIADGAVAVEHCCSRICYSVARGSCGFGYCCCCFPYCSCCAAAAAADRAVVYADFGGKRRDLAAGERGYF